MTSTVIFDMDGVIVDSELQWKLSEGPFFRTLTAAWRDEDHVKIVGLGVIDLYHLLVKDYGVKETKEVFLEKCHGLAEEIYCRRATPSDGILDFIGGLKKDGRTLGLASSSPRNWVDIILNRFDLTPHFSAVLSGDDVPGRTKPHPDIYLLAVKNLGQEPERCLAIEDSTLGVRSAKGAGLRCAAFRNGHNDDQDLSEADFEFRAFGDLASRL